MTVGIRIHNVEKVEVKDHWLAAGTYSKSLVIKSSDGQEMEVVMFSSDEQNLDLPEDIKAQVMR